MEGAVADHGAVAEVQVQHRREAQVDAARAQLGGHHVAGRGGGVGGGHRAVAGRAVAVVHPALAVDVHRRQVREAVGTEALHAAAFVVDAHEQVGPDRLHLRHQLGDLLAVDPVAAEQDRAAGERMREAAPVVGAQRRAGHVEDDGRVVVEARVGLEVQRLAEFRDDQRLAGRLVLLRGLLAASNLVDLTSPRLASRRRFRRCPGSGGG